MSKPGFCAAGGFFLENISLLFVQVTRFMDKIKAYFTYFYFASLILKLHHPVTNTDENSLKKSR